MAIKWREYQHPRNPDGTFRDKAAGDDWMRHVVGAFFPGEETSERMPADVFENRSGGDDDPDWEYDQGEDIWHETEISDGLHVVKRVGGSIELAGRNDDGTVTPLVHLSDRQARTFVRDVDFVDGIFDHDRDADYYPTATDEYGLLTHVRTGGRVIGVTPEGQFKIITLHGQGATSITVDRDDLHKLYQQVSEYEGWGVGDYDEDDEDEE